MNEEELLPEQGNAADGDLSEVAEALALQASDASAPGGVESEFTGDGGGAALPEPSGQEQIDDDRDDGSFRQIMAARGFGDIAGMDSDVAAFEAFSQRARDSQQQREVVQWGQWALQNMRDIERQRLEAQQWRDFQGQQQQYAQQHAQWQHAQQQQAQAAANAWRAPEYDPSWLNLVQEVADPNRPGETMWVSRPGAMPDLPQKIATYQRWLNDQQQKMWADPGAFVMNLIQPQIDRLAWERAQQAVGAYAQQQQAAQAQYQNQVLMQQQQQQTANLVNANAGWMFECGDNGQPIRNPYTGRFNPTPEGRRFYEHVQRGSSLGIQNDQALWEFARQSLLAELSGQLHGEKREAATVPAAQSAQQTQANKNVEFLRRSQSRAAKSNGARPPAPGASAQPPVAGKSRDFADYLRAAMKEANITDESIRDDDVLKHLVA